jgi:hypothetical protein
MSEPSVVKLIRRTEEVLQGYTQELTDDESMLSANKVTGYSLNFPIAATCQPSKTCIATCYFAKGGSSWPNALKRQYRLYNSVKKNPIECAVRLADEVSRRRLQLSFLRWNGGGELFDESVIMLNHFAELLPELPIWVVTRIAQQAASVREASNVFVHFSLDASSLSRRDAFERYGKKTNNYFYSYQCDKDEEPSGDQLGGVSVVFYDRYKPPKELPMVDHQIICPLNLNSDITGVCESCRRCFDGSAVRYRIGEAERER